jgi:RNA polymerase sigma factor (sigma-70 family)
MTDGERAAITRYLCRMVSLPQGGELTDAQLLEQFVARRDAAAFEVLVWRHGPKVLGVCRHVLRHDQDAEDAFQATFLVLVRKAGSIGRRQSVGGWLARVAYRVALRAKVLADRGAARGTPAADVPAPCRPAEVIWRDLRPVLDDEVNRLPEKYRAPFILCYLDGKTNEEAARELGCPRGTVASRLAWARERLRARLTRRGLTLPAALVAAALAGNASAEVLPAALVESTRQAALLVAAGKAVAEVASVTVATLTKGALQTMLWTKIKIAAACVLVAGTLGAGGALARQAVGSGSAVGQPGSAPVVKGEQPNTVGPPPAADGKKETAEPAKPEEKRLAFEMNAVLWAEVFKWYSEQAGLPFVGESRPTGTFTFIPPRGKRFTLEEITDILNEALQEKKYILVRRTATFTVLPADERIDPTLLPRVRPEDLGKRGKTELVTTVLQLTALNAKEIAPDVKKLLGPFGEVVVFEKGNQLILMDTAGNLRQVWQTIKDIETKEAEKKRDAPAK